MIKEKRRVAIVNINHWMSGKVVKWVENGESDITRIGFWDNTICEMEIESIAWGVNCLVYYEVLLQND